MKAWAFMRGELAEPKYDMLINSEEGIRHILVIEARTGIKSLNSWFTLEVDHET